MSLVVRMVYKTVSPVSFWIYVREDISDEVLDLVESIYRNDSTFLRNLRGVLVWKLKAVL